jgi:hypothetical protein
MSKPRILVLDIESSPNLSWEWRWFESNTLKLEQPAMVLMVGYKWFQEGKKAYSISMDQVAGYTPGRFKLGLNEKAMLRPVHELISEADYVVAHYGTGFDQPMLENRFIYHDLGPTPPYSWLDSKKQAAKIMKVPAVSLSLGNIGEYFNLGKKIETNLSLWFDCMDGDAKAWRKMRKYCEGDVLLLEKIYEKLLPYLQGTPNAGLFNPGDGVPRCPNPACGSDVLNPRGFRYTQAGRFQRYQCVDCGRYSQARSRELGTSVRDVPLK